jgi:hypothetical protein
MSFTTWSDVTILQSNTHYNFSLPHGGYLMPDRNFSYEDVNVDGAERIAEAAAKYDVDRFIHVSSYNASEDSPSEFFRTKVCVGCVGLRDWG